MSNIDKLFEYAENIVNAKSLKKTYKELSELFLNAGLYLEYTGIMSSLYNLNKDVELWAKMADIVINNLEDSNYTLSLYATYLKLTNEKLYQNLKIALQSSNVSFQDVDLIKEDDVVSLEFENLVNRHNIILYIMIYCIQTCNLEKIMDFVKYAEQLDSEIKKFITEKNPANKTPLDNMRDTMKHLSKIISSNLTAVDINIFATALDPINESSYLNVMETFLKNNFTKNAINFYNNKYRKIFKNNPEIKLPTAIYWFMSDKLYAENKYYESLVCQQKAIDIELSKGGR